MRKRPWMKFYPADWQADLELRSCSISARGMWMELLCIMQKADPEGYLLVSGKRPSLPLLSVLCGVSEKDTKRLLQELEDAGVLSRDDDGNIYSRRMVKDAQKAKKDADNGRTGGNPRLKGGVNPRLNGGDKAHMPEARDQRKNPTQEGSISEVERETERAAPFDVVEGGRR